MAADPFATERDYDAEFDEIVNRYLASRGPRQRRGGVAEAPAAAPRREALPLPPPIERRGPEVDESVSATFNKARGAPLVEEEGFLRRLAKAPGSIYEEVTQRPGAALTNLGKGALSGVTLGLSELSESLRPDPESWVGTAGQVAGGIVPGAGVFSLVGRRVASALAKNVIAGGITGAGEVTGRSLAHRQELPTMGEAALGATVGAVLPAAFHVAGQAGRRALGRGAVPAPGTTTPAGGQLPGPGGPGVAPSGAAATSGGPGGPAGGAAAAAAPGPGPGGPGVSPGGAAAAAAPTPGAGPSGQGATAAAASQGYSPGMARILGEHGVDSTNVATEVVNGVTVIKDTATGRLFDYQTGDLINPQGRAPAAPTPAAAAPAPAATPGGPGVAAAPAATTPTPTPAATPGAPAAAAPTKPVGRLLITSEMNRTLKDLGYTPAAIRQMTPEHANEIITAGRAAPPAPTPGAATAPTAPSAPPVTPDVTPTPPTTATPPVGARPGRYDTNYEIFANRLRERGLDADGVAREIEAMRAVVGQSDPRQAMVARLQKIGPPPRAGVVPPAAVTPTAPAEAPVIGGSAARRLNRDADRAADAARRQQQAGGEPGPLPGAVPPDVTPPPPSPGGTIIEPPVPTPRGGRPTQEPIDRGLSLEEQGHAAAIDSFIARLRERGLDDAASRAEASKIFQAVGGSRARPHEVRAAMVARIKELGPPTRPAGAPSAPSPTPARPAGAQPVEPPTAALAAEPTRPPAAPAAPTAVPPLEAGLPGAGAALTPPPAAPAAAAARREAVGGVRGGTPEGTAAAEALESYRAKVLTDLGYEIDDVRMMRTDDLAHVIQNNVPRMEFRAGMAAESPLAPLPPAGLSRVEKTRGVVTLAKPSAETMTALQALGYGADDVLGMSKGVAQNIIDTGSTKAARLQRLGYSPEQLRDLDQTTIRESLVTNTPMEQMLRQGRLGEVIGPHQMDWPTFVRATKGQHGGGVDIKLGPVPFPPGAFQYTNRPSIGPVGRARPEGMTLRTSESIWEAAEAVARQDHPDVFSGPNRAAALEAAIKKEQISGRFPETIDYLLERQRKAGLPPTPMDPKVAANIARRETVRGNLNVEGQALAEGRLSPRGMDPTIADAVGSSRMRSDVFSRPPTDLERPALSATGIKVLDLWDAGKTPSRDLIELAARESGIVGPQGHMDAVRVGASGGKRLKMRVPMSIKDRSFSIDDLVGMFRERLYTSRLTPDASNWLMRYDLSKRPPKARTGSKELDEMVERGIESPTALAKGMTPRPPIFGEDIAARMMMLENQGIPGPVVNDALKDLTIDQMNDATARLLKQHARTPVPTPESTLPDLTDINVRRQAPAVVTEESWRDPTKFGKQGEILGTKRSEMADIRRPVGADLPPVVELSGRQPWPDRGAAEAEPAVMRRTGPEYQGWVERQTELEAARLAEAIPGQPLPREKWLDYKDPKWKENAEKLKVAKETAARRYEREVEEGIAGTRGEIAGEMGPENVRTLKDSLRDELIEGESQALKDAVTGKIFSREELDRRATAMMRAKIPAEARGKAPSKGKAASAYRLAQNQAKLEAMGVGGDADRLAKIRALAEYRKINPDAPPLPRSSGEGDLPLPPTIAGGSDLPLPPVTERGGVAGTPSTPPADAGRGRAAAAAGGLGSPGGPGVAPTPGGPGVAPGGAAPTPGGPGGPGVPPTGGPPPVGAPGGPGGTPLPAEPSGMGFLANFTKPLRDAGSWMLGRFQVPERLFRAGLGGNETTETLFNRVMASSDAFRNSMFQMGTVEHNALQQYVGNDARLKNILKRAVLDNQNDEAGARATISRMTADAGEQTRLNNMLDVFNASNDALHAKLVELGHLRPEQTIKNWVPFMRDRVVLPTELQLEIGGGFRQVANWLRPQVRTSIEHRRTATAIPERIEKMSLEELMDLRLRLANKVISVDEELIHGGVRNASGDIVLPARGTASRFATPTWIEQQLPNVPDARAADMATYINDLMGFPRGTGPVSMDLSREIRKYQFASKIGASLTAPVTNITQNMISYALNGRPMAWVRALEMATTNKASFVGPNGGVLSPREFAELLGASGKYLKSEVLTEGLKQSPWDNIVDKSAWLFQRSEQFNQTWTTLHSYLAKLGPEALRPGAVIDFDQAAASYATKMNNRINKFGGEGNTPAAFRTPTGAIVGQFKSFIIGYMGFMKDATKGAMIDAPKAALRGDFKGAAEAALPWARYTLAVSALGGPEMIYTPEGVKWFEEQTGLAVSKFPNLLGYLGVTLGSQVGLGAVPFGEAFTSGDLKSALWFLPGPAISTVLDAASAVTYFLDSVNPGGAKGGFNLNPADKWGQPLTPDEVASKLVRAFPVGGTQLDRARKWLKSTQTGGDEVAANSFLQAIGFDAPTGVKIRPGPDPWSLEGLGMHVVQPKGRAESIQARGDYDQMARDYRAAQGEWHDLMEAGEHKLADRFKAKFERAHPDLPLTHSPQAARSSRRRLNEYAIDRLAENAPIPVRRLMMNALERD